MVKLGTRFPASHIAIILKKDDRIFFVEASGGSAYPDREGVNINYFSNSVPFYKGDIWIARLSDEVRNRLDEEKMYDFVMEQVGKGYDHENMLKAGLDLLDRYSSVTKNKEDATRLFCSELVAAAFKDSGILPPEANISEYAPADLVKLRIYHPIYYQIKAFEYRAVRLPDFNSVKNSIP